MKSIIKGSAVIFIFKIVGAISLFSIHMLISRYYGAETLGVFNLIVAILMISVIVSRMGLDIYVVRILPEIAHSSIQVAGFLQRVFNLVLAGSVVVGILLFLLSSIIDTYLFKSIDAAPYLWAMAIMILPFSLFNIIPEIFRGFHDVVRYSFYRNVAQNFFIFVVLATAIIFNAEPNPVWILYGVTLVLLALMAISLHSFLRRKDINLLSRGSYDRRILAYSYPMLMTTSTMFLMGHIDIFMIGYYLNEFQVGIYAACLKISLLITFILTSINGYIAPILSQYYSDNKIEKVKEVYRYVTRISLIYSLPIVVVVVLFPEFLLSFFGDEFVEYSALLMFFVAMQLVAIIAGPVIYTLNMTDQQHYLKNLMISALLMNIVLNAILIPSLGLYGAAVATVLTTIMWKAFGYYRVKRSLFSQAD